MSATCSGSIMWPKEPVPISSSQRFSSPSFSFAAALIRGTMRSVRVAGGASYPALFLGPVTPPALARVQDGGSFAARVDPKTRIPYTTTLVTGIVVAVASLIGDAAETYDLVGIAEKGFVSVELSIETAGGHSSMPPRRGSIGRLGAAAPEAVTIAAFSTAGFDRARSFTACQYERAASPVMP